MKRKHIKSRMHEIQSNMVKHMLNHESLGAYHVDLSTICDIFQEPSEDPLLRQLWESLGRQLASFHERYGKQHGDA